MARRSTTPGDVRRITYADFVATVEFAGIVYALSDDQTRLLAERLRNYAKGTFPDDVSRATELSGNPNWTDGALATADFLEEILVDNFEGPLPLEGKAAEATFWTLRIMRGLGPSTAPTDLAALRDALGGAIAGERPREAA
jgi:hypothetical protein